MQQRKVYLQEQMAKLLQEIEQNRMDQSRVDLQHFPSFTQWSCMIWALAALLLFLLFGFFFCCFRRRQRKTKLQRICESWGMHDQEEEELVDDEDPSDGTDRSRFYPKYSTWPLKYMQDKCSVVEELMDELLAACDAVAPSYFMPRLQAPVGVGIGFEGDSREGSHAVFRMLVPLQLPPGHDFHLELGPEGEVGLRNSRLRVELLCTCARELLLGDVLCFLHHPEDELRQKQMPSLLETLCTDSYLHMHKTATWFQELVREVWVAVPQSDTMKLELLPSARFCKLRLTTATGEVLWIELVLGVQQDGSYTFLSFE
ncbi:hypothetical protein ASZ78_011262 [Callipepla squamata]|uniref:Mab-21-like HhH/H2TH-like domain-containing protein n=1 Tax=Callipepla squamata TaxID=9009 RepID=A0A226MV42_CALSU|nr:hypothetical protein ASZ78_011262 [Callipepla squamata]